MQIVDQFRKNHTINPINFPQSGLRPVRSEDLNPLLEALKNSPHIDQYLPTARQMSLKDVLSTYLKENPTLVWDTTQGLATWLILHQDTEDLWLEFMTFSDFLGQGYMNRSLRTLLLNTKSRILAEADSENELSLYLLGCFGSKIRTRTGLGYYRGQVSQRSYEIFSLMPLSLNDLGR